MLPGDNSYFPYDGQIDIPPQDVSIYCIDDSVLNFRPSNEDYFDKLTNTRLIFNNCPISVVENDLVVKFTTYLRGVPSKYNWDVMCNEYLRFLYTANFDFDDAKKMMSQNYKYRSQSKLLPAKLNKIQTLLKNGCLYWHGRDRNARPTLVINPRRLAHLSSEIIDSLLAFTLEFFLRYLCVAGRAENYVIIVDCEHEGFISMPIQMANLFRDMSTKYRGRLYRIFFINTPKFFSVVLSSLTSLLPSSTCNKIVVLGDDFKKVFSANYNPWQLERKFGGEADVRCWYPFKFYPNCTKCRDVNANAIESTVIGSRIHDIPKIFFSGRCLVPSQRHIWQPFLNKMALTQNCIKYLVDLYPELKFLMKVESIEELLKAYLK